MSTSHGRLSRGANAGNLKTGKGAYESVRNKLEDGKDYSRDLKKTGKWPYETQDRQECIRNLKTAKITYETCRRPASGHTRLKGRQECIRNLNHHFYMSNAPKIEGRRLGERMVG